MKVLRVWINGQSDTDLKVCVILLITRNCSRSATGHDHYAIPRR